MMTATAQRERLTALARTRRTQPAPEIEDRGTKAMSGMRLFPVEVKEADAIAQNKCWKRSQFLRVAYNMGLAHYLGQEDRAGLFMTSDVAAIPQDETVLVPRHQAGLRLYPGEYQQVLGLAQEVGMEFAAPMQRFIYLLGLQQYKKQRSQVMHFGAQQ